jgi:hypothetical protein
MVKPGADEPESPWENGYIEWFNGKVRDELLNKKLFTPLQLRDRSNTDSDFLTRHRCVPRRRHLIGLCSDLQSPSSDVRLMQGGSHEPWTSVFAGGC